MAWEYEMVTDKHNKIYTELLTYMKAIYPDIKGGTVYEENKVKLPYLYFFQIDGSTKLMDLSNNEVGVNLAFQIEIYSAEGKDNSKKMASSVRAYMLENGFRCRTFMPFQSSSNVSRFITRFERLDV